MRRRALGTGNSDKLTPEASQREALRVLRSNLDSALRDLENPVVLVTSANEGEGKTSTCVPLARSMAAAGSGVVLLGPETYRWRWLRRLFFSARRPPVPSSSPAPWTLADLAEASCIR